MSPRLLFNKLDIFRVLEHQKELFKQEFKKVPDAELDFDAKGVIARLIEQFRINVPVLDDASKFARAKETQVDVSRDPTRLIRDRSRPIYIAGTEITFVVPFKGDEGLFEVQPTSVNLNPPYGEVHRGELHLIYTVTNAQLNVEDDVERKITQIKQYLDNLRHSAEQLDRQLEELGNTLLEQRKRERGAHSQILAGLKTPIRQEAGSSKGPQASVYPQAQRRARKNKQPDEWDVFISHATEDKQAIARPLADALKSRGVRVWYDDFALKLGDSLRESIDNGLAHCLFGVVILSPRFFEKHWPKQELNGLATKEVDGEKVILPVWHDIEAEQVRQNSPILADRKAVQTSAGLDEVVRQIMEVLRPQ